MPNQSIIQRDLAVLWHPCTQMKDHEALFPLIPIKRGEGVWLEDFAGNRYLDAISSWWVNLFGHANSRINAALRNQLEQLEHVILAGFTHEPILHLSERLVELTPPELTRCFYADNGSSCVEVALKMSFHFWQNTGQARKTKFIHLARQLSWGNARCSGGWRCGIIQKNLRAPVDANLRRAFACQLLC